jgi:Uncharacterized protein conserved in bacteria
MQEERRGAGNRGAGGGRQRAGLASASTLAGAGIEFAIAIVGFLYLGKWLDGRFGTSPVLMIVGVFVGAAGGFYSLYRSLMAKPGGSGDAKREPPER